MKKLSGKLVFASFLSPLLFFAVLISVFFVANSIQAQTAGVPTVSLTSTVQPPNYSSWILTWSTNGTATRCVAPWTSLTTPSGVAVVSPEVSTTYNITCYNGASSSALSAISNSMTINPLSGSPDPSFPVGVQLLLAGPLGTGSFDSSVGVVIGYRQVTVYDRAATGVGIVSVCDAAFPGVGSAWCVGKVKYGPWLPVPTTSIPGAWSVVFPPTSPWRGCGGTNSTRGTWGCLWVGTDTNYNISIFGSNLASIAATAMASTPYTDAKLKEGTASFNAWISSLLPLLGQPNTVSYPAGCTSSSGFSATTGQSCSGISNLPVGCTTSFGFSATTGKPCSGTTTAIPQPITAVTQSSTVTYNPYASGVTTGNTGTTSTSTSATVDLKVNSSNGPLTIGLGSPVILSWTVSGQTSCYKSSLPPSEFTGVLTPLNNGSLITYTPLGTIQYRITCGNFSDSVAVNTSNNALANTTAGPAANFNSGYARFSIGSQVMTTVNLNARASANLNGSINSVVPTGTIGTVFDGPTPDGGNNWYRVNYTNGMSGWSVETYLTVVMSSESQLSDVAQFPTTKFQIGDTVQTISNLNVRSTANGTILGTQTSSVQGQVLGVPVIAGGITWWNINYASGVDGWSAENFLTRAGNIGGGVSNLTTTAKLPPKLYPLPAEHDLIFQSGGKFDQYTNPTKYGVVLNQEGNLFNAAVTAGIVPNTPEGLETLLAYIGGGYNAGVQELGDVYKEFFRWYGVFLNVSVQPGGIKTFTGAVYYPGSLPNNYKSYTTDANGLHTLVLNTGAKITWGDGPGGTDPNYKPPATWTGKVAIDYVFLHKNLPAPYPVYAFRQQNFMSDGSIVGSWTGRAEYNTPAGVRARYEAPGETVQKYGSTVRTQFYVDLSPAEKAEIKAEFTKIYGNQLIDPETAVIGKNGQWIDKCSATITTNCL